MILSLQVLSGFPLIYCFYNQKKKKKEQSIWSEWIAKYQELGKQQSQSATPRVHSMWYLHQWKLSRAAQKAAQCCQQWTKGRTSWHSTCLAELRSRGHSKHRIHTHTHHNLRDSCHKSGLNYKGSRRIQNSNVQYYFIHRTPNTNSTGVLTDWRGT